MQGHAARLRDEPTVPLSVHQRELVRPGNWHSGTYTGPGLDIPPRREDCACACSATDEIGRPLHIGWCPDPDCERRPR